MVKRLPEMKLESKENKLVILTGHDDHFDGRPWNMRSTAT